MQPEIMSNPRPNRAEAIAGQILSLARREGWQAGSRLVELKLAEALGVSRGPVRAGLKALEEAGLAQGVRNHGFVLTESATSRPVATVIAASMENERLYRALTNDLLDGKLGQVVREAELMRRYQLTRPQLLRLLDRIAAEGWVERMPGYGWRFAEMLSSPAAYVQSAEFRRIIEPAALLDPGFRLRDDVLATLRGQQERLLGGDIDNLTITEFFDLGCIFHEELARAASNPFFVEALKRVNSIRRLFAYRMYADRKGIERHIREHMQLLDLLALGRNVEAADLMRRHLGALPGFGDG